MADNVEPEPPPPPPPPEVTVTHPITPIPANAPPPRQGCMAKRSTLEKILIVLVIIVLIICLAFLAAFIVFYFFASPPEGVCLTEQCVQSAARLKRYIDESESPCDNFYQYACGGWIKSQNLDAHQRKLGVESIIGDANRAKIRDLLQEPKKDKEQPYITQTKQFYATCMNTEKLNELGSEPFLKLLNKVGKFPTLNPDWNETDFKLDEILIKLTRLLILPLFTADVGRDVMNAGVYKIYLADVSLPLGSASKYKNGRNDLHVRSHEKWIVDNLVLLGASKDDVEKDVAAVVDFEIEIAKRVRSDDEKGDIAERYNPMTLATIQSKYKNLPLVEVLNGVVSAASDGGILFRSDETIINLEPIYFEKLDILISNTSKRIVANYLFSQLLRFTSALSSDFVAVTDQYNKATLGIDPKPRWERCTSETTAIFSDSVSRMYVDEFFSEKAKDYLSVMIRDLNTSFTQILKENEWMTAETKKKAEAKLEQMGSKVGYPEYIKNDTRLNNQYKLILANQYFESFEASANLAVIGRFKRLREPKDKFRWPVDAVTVNAQYDGFENEIIFPAAFLQAPVFSEDYSSSMNYGAIGMIIGHEITHGFDNSGHLYDGTGVFKNWWSDEDKKSFKERAQCFEDQYNCFKWHGHSINGAKTLGENIADNGGLKQSYRAYRNFIKRRGSEEPRLPGLKLNHNQIFFLSFAQVWCSKYRDEMIKEVVERDTHAPAEFRVKGSLQNSQEFADAFKCKEGARMHATRKCTLW